MNELITGAAIGSVVSSVVKGAKAPAQFVDDVMDIAGFGVFNNYVNKKRAYWEQDLADYKKKISAGLNEIEDENRQIPRFSILGPALEASKYYIEEEMLRDMFAKIVVASADISKNTRLHQSFVEILKQLSTHDAKHLVQIKKQSANPLLAFYAEDINGSGRVPIKTIFYLSDHITNSEHFMVTASLENLQRLGLIAIKKDVSYTKDSIYDDLLNDEFTKTLEDYILEEGYEKLKIEKSLLNLTTFGEDFCAICL